MSALSSADQEEVHDTLLAARARIEHLEAEYGNYMTLKHKVMKLHQAKGRYHTQLAAADLFEHCGLRAEKPKK